MPPKAVNLVPQHVDVVEIDSSDDKGGPTPAATAAQSLNLPESNSNYAFKVPKVETIAQTTSSHQNCWPLESRSFWKAGAYEILPTKTVSVQGDLEHARVHPKFLHSNATSHKWAFGAIAELLDNAVDEVTSEHPRVDLYVAYTVTGKICNGATYVKVDRIYNKKDNSPVLLFQDDGGGMDPEGIRKCMSLGYSSKTSNKTIGQYGNGFKTSTMRLGADAIVFSRASRSGRATQSIGLLSYTFLRRTGQDDVIVPVIDFDISDHWPEPILYASQTDWSTNLQIILEWSPFQSKDDLMLQFEDIGSHGTRVLVYNLWLNDEGIYELNFDDDEEDIRLRDEANSGGMGKTNKRGLELQSHISYSIRYSLRAYASILYLRNFTNFRILLRGKPVEQLDIANELKHTKVIPYRPQIAASEEVLVETKIGFIKEAPALGISGFNVYHKNRLIRPFWKVTGDGSSRGNGVVGVLEANFIEPAHDKQDFERSTSFIRLEMRLKQMVYDYWKGHCHLIGHQPVYGSPFYVKKNYTVGPQVGEANRQKRQQTGEHMHIGQPITGLTTNPLQISVAQIDVNGMNCNNELSHGQTFVGSSRESVPEYTDTDTLGSMSIDEICEENIQLFRRCEDYIQKENDLTRLVEELEKELEETKKKCAQLSSHLESQRKQHK